MSIEELRKTVAIVAAGKGGVGKTTHAVKLAEWYRRKGLRPVCFNADAFNTGLALDSYPALKAKRLELIRNGEIVKDGFHQMLESFATDTGPWVIDIGSNTYRQVVSYAKEMGLPDVLDGLGLHVLIHAIVAGGNMTADCVESVDYLAAALPWPFVLVLNEYDGEASVGTIPYLESAQFIRLAADERIAGIVRTGALTELQRSTLERTKDLRMTEEEIRKSDLPLADRIILESWSRPFFSGLDSMIVAAGA